MEADVVVDAQDLVRGLLECRPCPGIGIVAEGNDSVEAVVAAGHLDDDQDGIACSRLIRGRSGGRRPADETGHGRAHGYQARGRQRRLEEIAAVHGISCFVAPNPAGSKTRLRTWRSQSSWNSGSVSTR